MRCYQDEWPALVVTPKSLRETWADALFKVRYQTRKTSVNEEGRARVQTKRVVS